MKKNFSLDQTVGLNCGGRFFDLHNCYDFLGFAFSVEHKAFKLFFKSASDCADMTDDLCIEIVDVDSLELSGRFALNASRNLSEIGYKSESDRDHDWLVGEENCSPEDHIFFRFEGDQYIRVHGRYANVISK